LQQHWVDSAIVLGSQCSELSGWPNRLNVARRDGLYTQMTSVGCERPHALKGGGVLCDLNEGSIQAERWFEPLQVRNPLRPERHAALAQSPSATTGATEHMPHQHTQGRTGAITSAVRKPRFAGLIQPRIEESDLMSPLRQLPSSAEANGSSTNNSDGMRQLNASAGMTSE
jgi:hypothetical protein